MISRPQLVFVRFLGAGVLCAALSAFTPLPNEFARSLLTVPRLEPADAIVVLGGGLYVDGTLGCDALRRITHGAILYRKGLAPLLVFSGAGPRGGPTAAEAYRRLAEDLQISSEAIIAEGRGRTTFEEVVALAAVLRPRSVYRVLVVTNSFHLVRATGAFERAGFQVLPAPIDDRPTSAAGPQDRLVLLRNVTLELAARMYYHVAGYL